jgi:hypothetical protein
LGGSSLIFAGILELGYSEELRMILVSHSSVFAAVRSVGLIDFLLEDRLKRITDKAMSRSRILLLRNFLRRSLRLQHPECG